ncbi:MAG TPA: PAS domain-containing protein, partial [Usitatibacter sp.]
MSAIAKGPTRIDSDLVREALDRAPVGIAVLSTDGIFRFANRALCEMMGYPRSALEGQSYSAFVPAAELASDEEHLRAIREGGDPPAAVDTRLTRKDGTQLWVRVSATAIRDPSNETRYIVSAIVDLSEQREKDRSLRQTNSF